MTKPKPATMVACIHCGASTIAPGQNFEPADCCHGCGRTSYAAIMRGMLTWDKNDPQRATFSMTPEVDRN